MSDGLMSWLDARLAEAPPALATAVRAALPPPDGPCSVRDIEAAAERLMRAAQGRAGSRDGALTLLAADALTTLAHEWTVGRT